MKNLAMILSVLVSMNSFAGVLDVKPKQALRKGDHYVRITELPKHRVRFENCRSGLEDQGCDNLGNKTSYTIKELRAQRLEENLQVGLSVVGDVAAILAIVYGGEIAAAAIGEGFWGYALAYTASGTAVGGSALMVSVAYHQLNTHNPLQALNPIEQYDQAQTLKENIIRDEDVRIERSDMNDFISRLDLVLSKI